MSPRTERIAFQIWNLMEKTGGDCTVRDMAEVTGERVKVCNAVCKAKGWHGRYRTVSADPLSVVMVDMTSDDVSFLGV